MQQNRTACKAYCPHCNNGPLDGVTHMELAEKGEHTNDIKLPSKGDVTICSRCGEVLQYATDDLDLVPAPQDIIDDLLDESTDNGKMYKHVQNSIKDRYNGSH